MPLYQYKCPQCGRGFEILTSIDRRDEAVCPDCGAKAARAYEGKGAFGPMKYAGKAQSACETCPHACPAHA